MEKREHKFSRTVLSVILVCMLFAVVILLIPAFSASASDLSSEAAVEITAENLSDYTDKGITDEHIGYYAISTPENLFWYAEQVEVSKGNNTTINAVLTDDIVIQTGVIVDGALATDTSGFTVWTPIFNRNYVGTLDGNGHVIKGLFNNSSYYPPDEDSDYNGLFACADCTIRNLGIEDSCFGTSGMYNAGSFMGRASENSVIENCYSTALVCGSYYCGGIVGETFGTVRNCWFGGSIDARDNTSSAITSDYYNDGTIENCYYTEGCGMDSVRATKMTVDEVKSGLLTYLLSGAVTDGTQLWYQTVNEGIPSFSGATVYASQPCPAILSNSPVTEVYEHNYGEGWSSNNLNHWHTCSVCKSQTDFAQHSPDGNGLCECSLQMAVCLISKSGEVTFYPRLEDAENYCSAGDTIKLLKDCDESYGNFAVGLIFDLNGFEQSAIIDVYYDMTIIDSSDAKTGVISAIVSVSDYMGDNPTLTVKGGTFENKIKVDVECALIVENAVLATNEMNNEGMVVIKNMTAPNGLTVENSTLAELIGEFTEYYDEEGNVIELTDAQTEISTPFSVRTRIASVTVGEETTWYFNLEEAFSAANAATEATIKLLDSIVGDGKAYYATGKVTLDLNGKILSNIGLYAQSGGHLIATDSSEEQTGAFYSRRGVTSIYVQSGGTLEINAGYFDGSICFRSEENSELYIRGGTLDGNISLEGTAKNISITGGTLINFGVYFSDGALPDNISISGGAFEDGIYIEDETGCTLSDIIAENHFPMSKDGYITDLSGSDEDYCYITFTVVEHFHDYDSSYSYDGEYHWISCECGLAQDGSERVAHSGGEATCTEGAVCDICGYEYTKALGHSYGENGECFCGEIAPIIVTGDNKTLFFEKISDALNAAEEMESATVKLMKTVMDEEYNETNVKEGDITLDLNGYALYVAEINLYDTKFTVTDTSESGDGYFYADFTLDVYGGVLTVNAGSFEAKVDLESDDVASEMVICGDAIVEDSKLEIESGGILTVNGGTLDGTELDFEGGSLYVNGGVLDIYVFMSEWDTVSVIDGEFFINSIEYGDFGDFFGFHDCIAFEDEDGNAVELTSDMTDFETSFTVVHNESKHDDSMLDLTYDGEYHWNEYPCGIISGEKEAHSGGSATCTELAVCEKCEAEYGEFLPHSIDSENKCAECGSAILFIIEGSEQTVYATDIPGLIKAVDRLEKSTVTLLDDIILEEASEIDFSDVDVTLDLAGYKLINVYFYIIDASFTLNDSSEDGTGLIADPEYTSGVNADDTYYWMTAYGDSTLTLNGGTVALPADIGGNTVAVVNGGTFLGYYGIDLYNDSCVTVFGGTFNCYYEEFYYGDEDVSVVLRGGIYPNGLEVDNGDLLKSLSSGCYTYKDADGNAITLTDGQELYEG